MIRKILTLGFVILVVIPVVQISTIMSRYMSDAQAQDFVYEQGNITEGTYCAICEQLITNQGSCGCSITTKVYQHCHCPHCGAYTLCGCSCFCQMNSGGDGGIEDCLCTSCWEYYACGTNHVCNTYNGPCYCSVCGISYDCNVGHTCITGNEGSNGACSCPYCNANFDCYVNHVCIPNTWDQTTNNNISNLADCLLRIANYFINKLQNENGITVRIYMSLRTIEEQNQLYAQGRTQQELDAVGLSDVVAKPNLPVVTWVVGGDSYHNYGLAFDCVEIENGQVLWENPNWSIIGSVGSDLGLNWGNSFNDRPHFELNNVSISNLKNGANPCY